MADVFYCRSAFSRAIQNPATETLIKDAAERVSLPVHQISTFTSWEPPRPVDLIIAVSFGLLVPPRLLSLATYGGLNVHPSFLPDLHGPAPVHWAMLHRDEYSAVTLQTLHPSKFDQGEIVDQTPRPGIELTYSLDRNENKPALFRNIDRLGLEGAEMLRRNLENGDFLTRRIQGQVEGQVRHARKIEKEDRRLRPREQTSEEILRRDVVLDKLWDDVTLANLKEAELINTPRDSTKYKEAVQGSVGKRTIFTRWHDHTKMVRNIRYERAPDEASIHRLWHARIELPESAGTNASTGMIGADSIADLDDKPDQHARRTNAFLLCNGKGDWSLIFRTKDNRYVGPGYAQAEGKTTVPIGTYVGNVVSAVITHRRQQKELGFGFKRWRLPSLEQQGNAEELPAVTDTLAIESTAQDVPFKTQPAPTHDQLPSSPSGPGATRQRRNPTPKQTAAEMIAGLKANALRRHARVKPDESLESNPTDQLFTIKQHVTNDLSGEGEDKLLREAMQGKERAGRANIQDRAHRRRYGPFAM
ncbi:Formyl transferase-like protein [Elsinoe fawcettii]|nr:Formyl transferase-like protein [Elsinoe fawcettii]